MPNSCSAPRCTNSNKDGYCLITFAQDPKLKQEWIDAAGIPDWKLPKSAVLCEVHFHPSALYCVGNKKFIKKNAIPQFFCSCDKSIKRKPLAKIQSKEQQCNESIESLPHKKALSRSDHSYCFPIQFGQKNKRSKGDQYISEFKDDFSNRKSSECITFQSHKKQRTGRYVHTSPDCIIKQKPIAIDTLKKAFSKKENYTSDFDVVQDINTSPEITASEILSTESLPSLTASNLLSTESLSSPDELKLLKEKLEMAEKEKEALKSHLKYLEEKVEESTYIINKVLNKDQQEAILKGTTRGSKWSNETIKKGLNLHFACGSHGYKQIIEHVAPFPASRTLRKWIQHIKFEPGIYT